MQPPQLWQVLREQHPYRDEARYRYSICSKGSWRDRKKNPFVCIWSSWCGCVCPTVSSLPPPPPPPPSPTSPRHRRCHHGTAAAAGWWKTAVSAGASRLHHRGFKAVVSIRRAGVSRRGCRWCEWYLLMSRRRISCLVRLRCLHGRVVCGCWCVCQRHSQFSGITWRVYVMYVLTRMLKKKEKKKIEGCKSANHFILI